MKQANEQRATLKSGVSRRTFGFFLASTPLLSQTDQSRKKRTLVHDRDIMMPQTWRAIPVFGGGVLLGYEKNETAGPIIYTVDRDGRPDEMMFQIPDGQLIQIMNLAASAAGELAIIGDVLNSRGTGTTFLARISADRKKQTVTQLFPYLPKIVSFAPGGEIWTIGNLSNAQNTRDIADHVLRRFDLAGRMIDSRALQISGENGGESVSRMQSSLDRVAWLTKPGEYIEFAPNGSEIGRYAGPRGVDRPFGSEWSGRSLAISEKNDVFVGIYSNGISEIYLLDREARSWIMTPVPKFDTPIAMHRLLGFDGEVLVTVFDNGKVRRLAVAQTQ